MILATKSTLDLKMQIVGVSVNAANATDLLEARPVTVNDHDRRVGVWVQ